MEGKRQMVCVCVRTCVCVYVCVCVLSICGRVFVAIFYKSDWPYLEISLGDDLSEADVSY